MITEPKRLRTPSEALDADLAEIERRFHARKFGEELAAVNLEFTSEQRRNYLAWMRNTVRQRGRELPPSYSVAWMLKAEEDVISELNEKP
jgi:hypothetical protein